MGLTESPPGGPCTSAKKKTVRPVASATGKKKRDSHGPTERPQARASTDVCVLRRGRPQPRASSDAGVLRRGRPQTRASSDAGVHRRGRPQTRALAGNKTRRVAAVTGRAGQRRGKEREKKKQVSRGSSERPQARPLACNQADGTPQSQRNIEHPPREDALCCQGRYHSNQHCGNDPGSWDPRPGNGSGSAPPHRLLSAAPAARLLTARGSRAPESGSDCSRGPPSRDVTGKCRSAGGPDGLTVSRAPNAAGYVVERKVLRPQSGSI